MIKKILLAEFLLLAMLCIANFAKADEIFIRNEVLPEKYQAANTQSNDMFIKIPTEKNPHPIKPQICPNCGKFPCGCEKEFPDIDTYPCPAEKTRENE